MNDAVSLVEHARLSSGALAQLERAARAEAIIGKFETAVDNRRARTHLPALRESPDYNGTLFPAAHASFVTAVMEALKNAGSPQKFVEKMPFGFIEAETYRNAKVSYTTTN